MTRLKTLLLSVFLALPAVARDNPIVARMQAFAQACNAGDAAAGEIGETLISVGGRDIRSRCLHVWTLEDGEWRISRDIYNSIGPAS